MNSPAPRAAVHSEGAGMAVVAAAAVEAARARAAEARVASMAGGGHSPR